MAWQLALTISVLAGVVRILFMRRYSLTSKVPATIPPAASYLFGVIPVALIAGFFIFPHHVTWSAWVVVLMAILSVSMALSNWLGFIAAGKLAVAPQQTIGTLTTVGTVMLGWGLLGEGLSMPQFIGGTILLISSFLAIWAPAKTKTGAFVRPSPRTICIAVAAAVLLAVGLVTEKALLGHMQIGGIFLISWTVQTLGMVVLAGNDLNRKSWQAFKGREFRWSTFMGLVNGINGVFYVYAIFHSDNISLVGVLSTVGLPLTVLGAYIFLREREHHVLMWLSLGIGLAGLVVIAV